MSVTRTIVAVCVVAAAFAQERAEFRSNVELVTIPCTVVDGQCVAVAGLTREDFRVFDNGARRIVDDLWVDTDLPVTLGVLIDASESQQEQVEEHRRTARELMARILRPGDQAFVISVAEDIRLWTDLNRAPGELFGECG